MNRGFCMFLSIMKAMSGVISMMSVSLKFVVQASVHVLPYKAALICLTECRLGGRVIRALVFQSSVFDTQW